jgi:hypothetical protein
MATAQALGVDMSTLFGGRKLPSPESMLVQTEEPTTSAAPAEAPPEDNTAALAAEAAASDEPPFPDEPTGSGSPPQETEFERLGHSLREFLEGYKTELDVTTENGRNPYKMAEEELNNSTATEETRKSMINRLRAFLKAKGINV